MRNPLITSDTLSAPNAVSVAGLKTADSAQQLRVPAEALSFARDIRPMFRDTDVDTMQNYGLDLSSYAEVKNKVQAIYATLAEGSMPCDGAWPKDRVATLKRLTDVV